jgi:hypothetical protein
LGRDLQEGTSLDELRQTLTRKLRKKLLPAVAMALAQPEPEFTCLVPEERLELVLKTFMARKLVKMMANDWGSWSRPK